jgi:hypothetical protein
VLEAFFEFLIAVFKIATFGALIYKPQASNIKKQVLFEAKKSKNGPTAFSLFATLLPNVDFSLPPLNFAGSRVRVPPDLPLQRSAHKLEQISILIKCGKFFNAILYN